MESEKLEWGVGTGHKKLIGHINKCHKWETFSDLSKNNGWGKFELMMSIGEEEKERVYGDVYFLFWKNRAF